MASTSSRSSCRDEEAGSAARAAGSAAGSLSGREAAIAIVGGAGRRAVLARG